MLIRQKTVLALLSEADGPLRQTAFVKLVFLLRHETSLQDAPTFYDFVPYKYGPFSFTLYRELSNLRRDGYVVHDQERVALSAQMGDVARDRMEELALSVRQGVEAVVGRYGRVGLDDLLRDIYARYPWYATMSERTDLHAQQPAHRPEASPGVYTAGYEGKSVDAFFNRLLERGIRRIIDVRANAVSRRYGFSKGRLADIAGKLGLGYRHMPDLGIPSRHRANLDDPASYQQLLTWYEQEHLPGLETQIGEASRLLQEAPSVLVCMEEDAQRCHRSRLAEAISQRTGLGVVHI